MRSPLVLLMFVLTMLCVRPVAAAYPKPLFASDGLLYLTLKASLTNLTRNAAEQPIAGLLRIDGANSEFLPVMLSIRGTTRRAREVCLFPPLRVQFESKPAAPSLFRGQRSLKLVTHCRPDEDYQQHVLLEYAVYKLYLALTDESFNVRLAKIKYVDEEDRLITERFGFFIEDIDDVARRTGKQRLRNVNRISASQLDAASAARVAIFQYMIGNLDWAMTAARSGEDCCHNVRLIGKPDAFDGLIPIPYDFDYAGLVHAPYAVPPTNMKLMNVRIRRYRGFCRHSTQAQTFIDELVIQRPSLSATLDRISELNENTRQGAAKYLDDFFDQLGLPPQVGRLSGACLQ